MLLSQNTLTFMTSHFWQEAQYSLYKIQGKKHVQ